MPTLALVGNGQQDGPPQLQPFGDPPRWRHVGVRGTALASGVKGALRDRLWLVRICEGRYLAHAAQENEWFLCHALVFGVAPPTPTARALGVLKAVE